MSDIIKVNLIGGSINFSQLRSLCLLLNHKGIEKISFSQRQEILINVPKKTNIDDLKKEINIKLPELVIANSPNIISSLIASNNTNINSWIGDDVFWEIFDNQNNFIPLASVSIVHKFQNFVPLMTSKVNFVSSSIQNYWHILTNFVEPKWMNTIIHSQSIFLFLEKLQLARSYPNNGYDEKHLYKVLKEFPEIKIKKSSNNPKLEQTLPKLEGFHSLSDKTYLGIFNKHNQYSVLFLEELASISKQYSSNQLFVTPYSSILINNIGKEYLHSLRQLLKKYNINLRHTHSELFWQIDNTDKNSIWLKSQISQRLNNTELNLDGISLGIETSSFKPISNVIFKLDKGGLFKKYSIYIKDYLNQNSFFNQPFRLNLTLKEICYQLKDLNQVPTVIKKNSVKVLDTASISGKNNYQCKSCLTQYIEEFGDPRQNIKAGTLYKELPKSYRCNICGEPLN